MESIQIPNPSAMRIVFGYESKQLLFVSFFADAHDNSLYFRIHRDAEQSDVVHIQLPKPEASAREKEIAALETRLAQLKDERGTTHHRGKVQAAPSPKGPNFPILSVVAAHPSKMTELPNLDPRLDIYFTLNDDIRPFVVNFIAHRKNSAEMPIIEGGDLMGGSFMQCNFADMTFDLLISLSAVGQAEEAEGVNWPPFPVVLKRIGKNEIRRSREIP